MCVKINPANLNCGNILKKYHLQLADGDFFTSILFTETQCVFDAAVCREGEGEELTAKHPGRCVDCEQPAGNDDV